MIFFHDSRSAEYRLPAGAMPAGGTVRLRVFAQSLDHVTLRVWWDGREYLYPMERIRDSMYETRLPIPEKHGLLWYFFMADDANGTRWYLGNASDGLGGEGMGTQYQPASYQITVYDKDYHTPEWMRDSVMMQIMVDRFANAGGTDLRNLPAGSYYHPQWDDDPALVINDRKGDLSANDFFGGNLKGVEEKLEYLSSLGVSVLYFNPIFQANSNHKYNTGDYRKIDPSFGTEEDFVHLCESARKKGIRIILDGVFSHTGSDSLYFDRYGNYGGHGAYLDPDSPYRSWYMFRRWPDIYESWWGFTTLPNVQENDPGYRRFIISDEDSVIAHWLRRGARGWRLDVADELPMDFIRALRRREKEVCPDAALIGEVWEDPSNKVAYGETRCYCEGDTLDATMNYPLRQIVLEFLTNRINAQFLIRQLQAMWETQPKEFSYSQMNLLSSHDQPRALTVLADIGDMEPDRPYRYAIELNREDYLRGRRRLIAAWNLICFLPGMPCIYYGDEAGLYGMSDPYCRGTYPWGREDLDLIEEFRKAARFRRSSPALRRGAVSLSCAGEDVLLITRKITEETDVFGRKFPNESHTLAVNRSGMPRWLEFHEKTIEIPAESACVLD